MTHEEAERLRALALYQDGIEAFRAGDQQASREKNEAALDIARGIGDREAEALALVGLSRIALREREYAAVCSLAREARHLVQGLDPEADASPLHMLAAGTRLGGDYDEAAALYAQSLKLNRDIDSAQGVCMELHNLGFVELHRGRVDEAELLFAEAAEMSGEDPYDLAMNNLEQAALAAVRGSDAKAAELLGHVESRLRDAKIVLDPDDAFEVDWVRAHVG